MARLIVHSVSSISVLYLIPRSYSYTNESGTVPSLFILVASAGLCVDGTGVTIINTRPPTVLRLLRIIYFCCPSLIELITL